MAFGTIMGQTPDLTNYVKKTGDTITGPILYDGAPNAGNELVNKDYVDKETGGLPITNLLNIGKKYDGEVIKVYDKLFFSGGNYNQTLTGQVNAVLPEKSGGLIIELSGGNMTNFFIPPQIFWYDYNNLSSTIKIEYYYLMFGTNNFTTNSTRIYAPFYLQLSNGVANLNGELNIQQKSSMRITVYFGKIQ